MSHPHHLTEIEWNEYIDSKKFQIVEKITPEILSNLNVEGSLYLQTARENAKIPYDRHKWSHAQKGSIPRHQPSYKRLWINGTTTHSVRCTSVSNPEFKKDVLHLGNATYYHYFLTGNGVYREPEEDQIKKPRITGDTAEQLRDILKAEGSAKDAYELAQSQGLQVSKRQCHNQLRNIRESTSTEPKEKIVRKRRELTMEQLNLLKSIFPNDVSICTDANGQVHYQVKITASGKIDQMEEYVDEYSYEDQFGDVEVKEEPTDPSEMMNYSNELNHFPKYEFPL